MATFYNQATLTYNNTTTNSNIVSGELIENLSAVKTTVEDSYAADGTVTYLVSLVNSDTSPYTGFRLTDNLGSYTAGANTVVPLTYVAGSLHYYVNGILQATPTVADTDPLTISGLSIPAGGNILLVYQAVANEFAPLGDTAFVENTVTFSGGTLPSDITAENRLAYFDGPILSISKSVSPDAVSDTTELTYTFLIQNSGNTPVALADNAVITDTFDPALTLTAVTFNGTAWTSPTNYSYSGATGLFTSAANQIAVPAASYVQNTTTGAWSTVPGISVLKVSGIIR